MSMSRDAEADQARDAESQAAVLDAVLAEAQSIAGSFTAEHSDNRLQPAASVVVDVGGDDRPLFVFSMDVDLEDDLDTDDYPLHEIQKLTSELRSLIIASSVVDWSWLVTAGTKATASH